MSEKEKVFHEFFRGSFGTSITISAEQKGTYFNIYIDNYGKKGERSRMFKGKPGQRVALDKNTAKLVGEAILKAASGVYQIQQYTSCHPSATVSSGKETDILFEMERDEIWKKFGTGELTKEDREWLKENMQLSDEEISDMDTPEED